jgi:hypothetical protein
VPGQHYRPRLHTNKYNKHLYIITGENKYTDIIQIIPTSLSFLVNKK